MAGSHFFVIASAVPERANNATTVRTLIAIALLIRLSALGQERTVTETSTGSPQSQVYGATHWLLASGGSAPALLFGNRFCQQGCVGIDPAGRARITRA